MPISSLSLILTDDSTADAALEDLEAHPHVLLGAHAGRRIAAVLDTPDEASNKRSWAWLNGLSGVRFVHVLFVHFDPQPQE